MDLTPEGLRENIIEMASIAEKAVSQCLEAERTMQDVFELEKKINDFHKHIDDTCFKYMALKRPAARDLRLAVSIMRINSDLERIGDQAVNIKRYLKKIDNVPAVIKSMGVEVSQMLRNGIDSFLQGDIKLASDVIQNDQEINEINRDILKTYLSLMQKQDILFDDGFAIIRIAKNLERVGDLTTNIAEDVIFLESGNDIRHNSDFKFGRRKYDKEKNTEEAESQGGRRSYDQKGDDSQE
jgi:phosphate transport system protein